MRILFIVHQFMPEYASGTERVTLNLAKAAQRDGHQVEVLTRAFGDPSRWRSVDRDGVRFAIVEGVPVHGLPGAGMTSAAQLGIVVDDNLRIAADGFFARNAPYDIVHVTHALRMLEAVESVRDRGLPYLVTLTDFFLLCHRINLMKISGKACSGPRQGKDCAVDCTTSTGDGFAMMRRHERLRAILDGAVETVACSEFVAAPFEREYPTLAIRVIDHGVDLRRFGRPSVRLGKGGTVFGYLGTLSEAKGVLLLADAFAKVTSAEARLELVGPSYGNDDVVQQLGRLVANDSRIRIRQAVPADEVPTVLYGFDVFCLPSSVPETFSLSLHEAFAAGLPCLVSDHGLPAAIVRASGCGEALPAGDGGAWRNAIARVASDPAIISTWRERVPMPTRVEEEGFLYSHLYEAAARPNG